MAVQVKGWKGASKAGNCPSSGACTMETGRKRRRGHRPVGLMSRATPASITVIGDRLWLTMVQRRCLLSLLPMCRTIVVSVRWGRSRTQVQTVAIALTLPVIAPQMASVSVDSISALAVQSAVGGALRCASRR